VNYGKLAFFSKPYIYQKQGSRQFKFFLMLMPGFSGKNEMQGVMGM